MCSSCAIISSLHSAEHACRNSTSVCSIHDFPYNKLNKKSLLQAAADGMCRHAVAKVWLLIESGFYPRAAFIQDLMVLEEFFSFKASTVVANEIGNNSFGPHLRFLGVM